jgi:hypothetical protein
MRNLPLYEQWLNEIGDSSAKPFKWKVITPYKKFFADAIAQVEEMKKNNSSQSWLTLEKNFEFEIYGEKATYVAVMLIDVGKVLQLIWKPGGSKPATNRKKYKMVCSFHFDVKGSKQEINTNLNEHFSLMASLTECALDFIKHASQEFKIEQVDINAKADDSDEEAKLDSKRGRLYLAYIRGNIRKLEGDWTAELTDYGVTLKSGIWSTADGERQAKMFYNK